MTPQTWIELQSQLWSAFAPLISWALAFFMAGLVLCASLLFAGIYFSEWLTGS